jgi:hypothetical protein
MTSLACTACIAAINRSAVISLIIRPQLQNLGQERTVQDTAPGPALTPETRVRALHHNKTDILKVLTFYYFAVFSSVTVIFFDASKRRLNGNIRTNCDADQLT